MSHCRPGRDPGFSPQDFAALDCVTTGPVLFGGCGAWAPEAVAWGGEPAGSVGAADAADVVAAVRFAAQFGLPLTVCAPGRDPGPPCAGGLLLTTARLDRIHVDRVGRTAIAGAGARWSVLVRRAAEVGLAPLVPAYGEECVVGSVHGWTAGHVLAIEFVDRGGGLRRVTPTSDCRLFARLCRADPADTGAGVVTEMTFALFR
jgi:FAD/FMN-containing dehydrogenase